MAIFWGQYEKRIDKKGRVSVPSEFRTALAQAGAPELVVLPEPKQPFLRGMPVKEFHAVLAQLKKAHGRFTASRTRASRFVFGRAKPIAFDPEGRIILPKDFLDYAGIDGSLFFVGAGDHFQIWDPARLADEEAAAEAEAADVLEGLEGVDELAALGPEGLA